MSWRDLTTQQFSFLIFVFVVCLSLDTAFAILTHTLWAIAIAIPWLLTMPVEYQIEKHVKRNTLGNFVWKFLFMFTMLFIFNYFGPQWAPYPHFTFAIIQYLAAFCIFIVLSASLCERYLKPKLGSSNENSN